MIIGNALKKGKVYPKLQCWKAPGPYSGPSSIEFQTKHLLVIAVLALAFSCALIMRFYPIKYGYYLNEFDPYFDYRATKFIVDNGLNASGNGMIQCHGILKAGMCLEHHNRYYT